jgi:hypothetical protein
MLENAGRRSAEAAQEKLNVIAAGARRADGLARRRGPLARGAATRLRDAVGLEERH